MVKIPEMATVAYNDKRRKISPIITKCTKLRCKNQKMFKTSELDKYKIK